jgi:hypothetical protein
MPCKIRNGMIICSRGHWRPPKCQWCDKPSTKLCDYPIEKGRTCDAPMCEEHAKRQGPNVDTCPNHPHMRYF